MDDCCSDNRNNDASMRALTIKIGFETKDDKLTREVMPDTIQLFPWYLKQFLGPPTKYDMPLPAELIQKAADMKARVVVGKLTSKLTGDVATPIDSLAGFAHVLFHEVRVLLNAGSMLIDDCR
jgi:hypothetical protein